MVIVHSVYHDGTTLVPTKPLVLKSGSTSANPGGTLIEFDQAEFLPDPTAHGMGVSGFVYVPESCAEGALCRVHVAFHGCNQTTDLIGDAFLTETGYRRWADTNHLIILYPQAHSTRTNPNACWDWWGYDDQAYATKEGRQMAAVWSMIERLGGMSRATSSSSESSDEQRRRFPPPLGRGAASGKSLGGTGPL